MYTIGQFALILKVSTRTLRHYDEIDLLKPQHINQENNYRYYGREQLGLGKSIVKLKEYGLSLEEIREIVIEEKNYKEIIKKRLDFIKREISKLTNMKESLDKILREEDLISKPGENINNLYEIEIVEINEINVVSEKVIINIKDTGRVVGSLYELISRNGLKVTGGHIIRYFGSEYDPENTEVEVCIPVESRKECKIKFGSIPKGKYVKVSVNSIREKGDAYVNIINWAQENNLIIEGNPFEQYSLNVQNKGFNVEIYLPIKK